jgi:methyl-accepting chemotaxis protein
VSIANRILAGFAAATLIMVALGLFSLGQLGSVRDDIKRVVSRDLAFATQLGDLRAAKQDMQAAYEITFGEGVLRASGRTNNLERSAEAWRDKTTAAEQALDRAIAAAAQYESTALATDRAAGWAQVGQALTHAKPLLQDLRARNQATLNALAAGDINTAIASRDSLRDPREALDRDLAAASQQTARVMALGQARIDSVYDVARLSTLVGILLAVLIAVGVALLVRRSIVGPLEGFKDFVERVGRGDLSGQTAATSNDEIGRLGGTLNGMVDGLKDLAKQNREATENLNAATAEIRASTQEQAASVEEQLAAVQETAATVDEITHSGAQIGKRAQEVIAAAQATAQTSSDGLRAVDETARAMDAIREQAEAVAANIVALSEKTQAIGDIIATVNDVSERSHLLALNAAIEAASAGESGRGFSVVASEMKMLAEQAKEATNQVRSILGDVQRGINASVMLTEEAVKRVTAGKERTDTTQKTITEITSRVQESVQTFQQIVASTNQQQLGIEQVMGALQNIRQASQQTAAGTRQLDEAAANLSNLSRQLLALAERYRT